MNQDRVRGLLDRVAGGEMSADDALREMRWLPFEDTGYARVDQHRALRQGFPEAIFCETKTVEQVVGIARHIVDAGGDLLATRLLPEQADALCAALPNVHYNATARVASLRQSEQAPDVVGTVLIICAGTSDLPVAEEAVETARLLGHPVELLTDVGVAGLHRLLEYRRRLDEAGVIIVVAGMEGALASVVGGLVDVPVVAVPTSVGYGAHLGGIAPLLGMLNSCAAGVTVVNIDNGFGAAMAACSINRVRKPRQRTGQSPD